VALLRVAYFGTPDFAVPGLEALIASQHDVAVLVSQPDRPRGRGQRLQPTPTKVVAEAAGIPVLQPTRLKDESFLNALRSFDLDLGVVAAYGRIIPDAVLALPRLGLINIHASLLPAWRGAAPIHRAVINGDRETGVTIMRVVTALDAGPTFAEARRAIGPDETTPEVERALARLGAGLAVQVVDALAAGTAIETPQDDSRATYANKIERGEGTIDWTQSAQRIHDLVRGLQPWPLVSATIGGLRCLIHRTEVTSEPTDARAGTIAQASGGVLAVAGGDRRLLHILELQPEGRRPMPARDFLAGRRVELGAPLSNR
jgi:methionyl-tRNA formyltransferase